MNCLKSGLQIEAFNPGILYAYLRSPILSNTNECIFFPPFSHNKMNSLKPWRRENDTYENNEKARKAYEALLIVTAREPEYDQFRNFYLNIKEIAKAKFKYDYQLEEVTSFFSSLGSFASSR